MSEIATAVLGSVRALPEADQRAIADAVYGALSACDDVLFEELERRRAEHESGHDAGVSADDLFGRLEKRTC